LNKPEYVKVDDKLYKINTDFRVAIECNKIATDKKIGDTERALAIIYKLFGEDGLDCTRMNKLIELGLKYISIFNDFENGLKDDLEGHFELDMSKCKGLISSSFKFDYGYDPYELPYLHWYDFYNDLSNLSTSEFGNCCILNRIISILNQEPKKIKDNKDRQKLIEAQKMLKAKYCVSNEKEMTKEQKESAEKFYELLGLNN
jgi:hypothetical protein